MHRNSSIAFFERLTAGIIRFRWLTLLGVVLLTAFFMVSSSSLKFNGSFEIWFFDNDPAMHRLNAFKDSFGNDQFVYILVETDGVFKPENAAVIKRLSEELERTVPYLRDLTWVGNAEHISASGNTVFIQELLEDMPANAQEADRRQALALKEKDFVNRYISEDGKAAGILIELEKYPEGHIVPPPSTQVAMAVFQVLEKPEYAGLDLRVVGHPIFETRYNQVAGSETPKFFGLCILVQAILLFLFTRSLRGVLVPVIVVTLSFFWTLGTIALIGFDLDLMIIGLPVMLICVGIGDAMHAIADYNHHASQSKSRKEALLHSMGRVGLPCLLTSLTTAIGFFAFSSAPIKPFLHLAVYLPAGVLYAFVLTMVLVPVFYSFGKERPGRTWATREMVLPEKILDALGRLVTTRPRMVMVAFVIFMALGVGGSFLVQVESNPTKFLTKRVPLRQDVDYVDNRMAGSTGLEIVVNTGRPDGIKDLAVLRGMEQLSDAMEQDPLVHKSFSVVDVLKKMRRALHGDDEKFNTLPDKQAAVPEYLALYEMSGGDQMDKIVSFDGSTARINLQTRTLGSSETRELMDKEAALSEELFPEGVKVTTTGFVDIAKTLNDNMATAQSRSIALAFAMITVVMVITLRSIPMGLISMVPNIMPVFMILGLLGFTGIYMDTILMSVSAMIIGVAVDDTIHFFIHFRREFDLDRDYAGAIRRTIKDVGRPIMFTTLTLTLGFLVLACSVMVGWIKIGILAGFAFLWALVADLIFAPALLMLLKPLGKGKNA